MDTPSHNTPPEQNPTEPTSPRLTGFSESSTTKNGVTTQFIGVQTNTTRYAENAHRHMNTVLAGVLDTFRESALILSADGHIEQANHAFLQAFHKTLPEVKDQLLWNLGDAWNTPALKSLLLSDLPATPTAHIENAELTHDFQNGVGTRHLRVNARRLLADPANTATARIILAIEDISETRAAQQENQRLRDESQVQLGHMLRTVLSAATENKLTLCLTPADLPPRATQFGEPFPLTLPTLRDLRQCVRQLATQIGNSPDRVDDFENAVGEAAMNAVVHGGGGASTIGINDAGNELQVWITDNGCGIPVNDLPRALLEKGFSSKGTMGQGLKIILQTADRVYLSSTQNGTTLVLVEQAEPPLPEWMHNLDNFSL